MGELGKHQAAFLVHGLGQRPVAGNDTVVDIDQCQAIGPDLGPFHRRGTGDLHAQPGPRALAVIVDIALARQAVFGQSRLMGGKVDADPGDLGFG